MEPDRVVRQLPRGRHGLTREEVVTSQRMRMLEAMGEAVAEKGYVSTSVADVIKRAGVSRETFYEQFDDKEACFLAAYDTIVELMLGQIALALADASGDPLDKLSRALKAYLEAMASEPKFTKTFLIDVYAAGPKALERRHDVQQRFVDTVAALLGARTKRDRFACEAYVAAISSLVTTRVGAGRTDELPGLHAPMMDLVARGLEGLPAIAKAG